MIVVYLPRYATTRNKPGAIVEPMPRDRPLPGGKLEHAVLVAVWEGGTVTVRELHERA